MPTRKPEEHEYERKAKLAVLRNAAKEGFDEIDQGHGIVLKDKKALDRFIKDIEIEILAKTTGRKQSFNVETGETE
ncbi:MAG: hypothetical protein HY289_16245 [Planctomycetes bacterium]|nr:hypothetical protein [Planctomycetota bacterium]